MIKLTSQKIIFLQIILIVVLGICIYANCINGGFIWDDHGLVKDNVYLKNWSSFLNVFTTDFGSGSGISSNFYRPLQSLMHMFGYSLWGTKTSGYHLTSILAHILATIIFFFLLRNIFYDKAISFLASLLFLTCPVNTEAVCYISGLSDPLALVFILTCLNLYLRFLSSNNIVFLISSLLSFVLALLSKESAVVLPLLILLYHYVFLKKIRIKILVSFFSILFGYILFRVIVLNSSGPFILTSFSLCKRVPNFFAAVVNYLRLLLLPFDLHMEYASKLFKFNDPEALIGLILTFSLIIVSFIKRKNNPVLFFGIFWFFIALLPVSNIYPISYSFMMEHYLYLPALGFFIIFASLLCSPFRNKLVTFFLRFCIIGVIIFYSYLTTKQSQYWKQPTTFYKRTLQFAPESWRFYNELGIEYASLGSSLKAEAAYREALRFNPNAIGVYHNLIRLYMEMGNREKLLATYKTINTINLKLAEQYYAAGNQFKNEEKYAAAIGLFIKALEFNQNNLIIISELASTYVLIGEYEKAIILFKKAIEIKPDFALAYNNLAVTYYYLKQYALAIKNCNKALELGYPVESIFIKFLEPYKLDSL